MKRTFFGAGCVLVAIGAAIVVAQETLPLNGAPAADPATAKKPTVENHYSYAIGLDMGNSFRSSETPLDIQSLVAGLQAGLSGAEPKYDQETCGKALQQLQMRMRNKQMAEAQAAGAGNRKAGDAFLAKNKTKEGVKVTDSGLQYKVIKAGTGPTPSPNDTVRCNYRGTLIDGQEFDASKGKPIEFPVLGVIPGWTEALQKMKVGGKWQLLIPADLAYGDQQRGPLIAPGSTLVFDIELLGIVGR